MGESLVAFVLLLAIFTDHFAEFVHIPAEMHKLIIFRQLNAADLNFPFAPATHGNSS
jgi:hypothetical protein